MRPDKQRARPAGDRSGSQIIAADTVIIAQQPIFSTARRVRLWCLDDERPVQPGDDVRVLLGRTEAVSCEQAWRIRYLVAGARSVEIDGSSPHVNSWLRDFLAAHPDLEVAG